MISPDGRWRLETTPVRTRKIDTSTGEASVVLEGWHQLEPAWLPGGQLCVLCAEGEVDLDLADPEIGSLHTLREAFPGPDRVVRVRSSGLLHVIGADGEYLYHVKVDADRVESCPERGIVVLTRGGRNDPRRWRTAILATTPAGLAVVAKYPDDLHGASGSGLDVATTGSWRAIAIDDSIEVDRPPPPPPATLSLAPTTALTLVRVDGARRDSPDAGTERDDVKWSLQRIHLAHSEVVRLERRDGAWTRTASLAVEGFDRLHTGDRGRLIAVTINNAPPEMAWSMLVAVDEDGVLRNLGRLHHVITGMWDADDGVHLELLGGHVYRVEGLGEAVAAARAAEPRPLLALVFDVPGHYGRREFLPRHGHDIGFIDREGTLVIDHQFTSVYDFEGGAARAAHAGSRLFGLVDRDGRVVVPHHYNWIGELRGGCRRIGRGEPDILGRFPERALWGLLGADGSIVLAPEADGCGSFGDGLCPVRRGELWGYVDPEGRWAIEPRFRRAEDFAGGLAAVTEPDADGWRLLDPRGRWVGEGRFDDVGTPREGLVRVAIDGRWGFLDAEGAVVIPPRFDLAFDFHDGRASVRVGDRWTWIDRDGRLLGEPRFDRAFDFAGGIAVYQRDAFFGYVSTSGEVIVDGFEAAGALVEERAAVCRRARWGFIDRTGELVVPPRYASVRAFSEGVAVVRAAGRWGVIDAAGAVVLPPTLGTCGSFHEGRAWITRRG